MIPLKYAMAILFILWLTGVAAVVIADARRFREDGLVRLIEQMQGISPGTTRVIPQCSCTIRYNGTEIIGRHYHPDIERLD